ncbi:MAG: helix-turn-helix domain-containing protein [Planctomycetota bacterium]|nr:helix-turn-helix domain-containing protein [Planctomycetaceae bacterium]MDQ3329716.1 helix-turn-helix domain-containing protein [Planctomycetota bacterium]
MSNSIIDAERLSLSKAARTLGVHVSTLHRWRLNGVRGHRLRVVRIGGRSYVLRDELERFVAALSDPPTPPTPKAADADFARRAAVADAKARALGL